MCSMDILPVFVEKFFLIEKFKNTKIEGKLCQKKVLDLEWLRWYYC